MPRTFPLLLVLILASLIAPSALAQNATGAAVSTLTGVVEDSTGAVIPGARLVLHPLPEGADITAVSGPAGVYTLAVPAGTRGSLSVQADGFAPYTNAAVRVSNAKQQTLNIKLTVAATDTVNVSDTTVDTTDPNNNGDALTLKGKALDQLPTDSTQLLQQLQALSGGPSPDLFVDGFSGGSLPPKDTIRLIRINQNPYSAQNDTNPVNGRIEIFTQPGSAKLHGDFYVSGNDSALNSKNPFAPNAPAYYSFNSFGSLGGPINKKSSFFGSFGRRSFQGNSIVNAQTDTGLYVATVSAPTADTNFSARYDASLGKASTVIARYSLDTNYQLNSGVGQLTLPSAGTNNYSTVQTLQLSNSQIVSAKIVNDTRFQYIRTRNHQSAVSGAPSLTVEGAFVGGGSSAGASRDDLDRYELQSYTTAAEGKHYFDFGGRLRVSRDANVSLANYNGSFTFASLTAYEVTQEGLAAGLTPAQISANGGGASLFSLQAGTPSVVVSIADVGLFLQDDVKLKPNLTLSGGLRFESQTGIHDHGDWAPRLGLSWALGAKKDKPAPYTLRGGAGIFYSRFSSASLLQAVRQNGTTQQQYLISSPTFYPVVPSASSLAASAGSSITNVSPGFHAPYFISTTAAVDRRIGSYGTLTASWVTNRGVHTQLERNINAPLPGTYNVAVAGSGVRPYGGSQDIYQYQSEGISNSERLNVNYNLDIKKVFLFGYYTLLANRSDTDGGFPSNQYDLGSDYGRASNDVRNSFALGGGFPLPLGFGGFIFLRTTSGTPFNITVGQDLNGDSQYNDRPAFATDLTRASVVMTKYGNFDTSPMAGQTIIPRNYGTGPGYFGAFFSLDKTVMFGPAIKPPAGAPLPKLAPGAKAPKPDRKYELHLSLNVENVTNHESFSLPVGVLGSPLFGHSTALANGNNSGNREVDLQSYFRF